MGVAGKVSIVVLALIASFGVFAGDAAAESGELSCMRGPYEMKMPANVHCCRDYVENCNRRALLYVNNPTGLVADGVVVMEP